MHVNKGAMSNMSIQEIQKHPSVLTFNVALVNFLTDHC